MKKPLLFTLLIIIAAATAVGTYNLKKHFAVDGLSLTNSHSLSITSSPKASVFLNGDYSGLTPLTIDDLSEGMYALRLTREGYISHQEAVDLGQSQEIAVELKASPKCSLTIKSTPDEAIVFLDGTQRGRTPFTLDNLDAGKHFLKLVKTNYFSATSELVLEEGKPSDASFKLINRYVHAYRAALEINPYNMAAYNDLGEQLYVLGRYQEAAEVYVEGYIAASPPFKGKISGRDSSDRQRLLKEPRNIVKHPAPAFQEALNRAVFTAMGNGIKAACLIDDFKKIPRGRYPEAAVEAMDLLLGKHPEDLGLILKLIPYYNELNANQRLLELFDIIMNSAESDYSRQIDCAQLILHILDKDKNTILQTKLKEYIAQLKPVEKTEAQAAQFTYITGWLAFTEGNSDKGKRLWKKAIDKQSNSKTATRWRLELAERYQNEDNYPAAAKIIYTVIDYPNHNSPLYRRALKMEQALPTKFRRRR